jgi:hypothetical protein
LMKYENKFSDILAGREKSMSVQRHVGWLIDDEPKEIRNSIK